MANVLKSESASTQAPSKVGAAGLAGFNLSDLADEGRQQLERCREQIREMMAAAKDDAESIRNQARSEGYQAGLQQAAVDADKKLKQEAEVRAKDSLRLIRAAVGQLHRTHQDWMSQYSRALCTTAVAAAERVVRRKLADEPSLVAAWAEEAVRSTRSSTRLTLVVHPETLAQLGQTLDELLAMPGMPEQAHVEADESLAVTDVVVRQSGGEIQAGLAAQLARLEELLS